MPKKRDQLPANRCAKKPSSRKEKGEEFDVTLESTLKLPEFQSVTLYLPETIIRRGNETIVTLH